MTLTAPLERKTFVLSSSPAPPWLSNEWLSGQLKRSMKSYMTSMSILRLETMDRVDPTTMVRLAGYCLPSRPSIRSPSIAQSRINEVALLAVQQQMAQQAAFAQIPDVVKRVSLNFMSIHQAHSRRQRLTLRAYDVSITFHPYSVSSSDISWPGKRCNAFLRLFSLDEVPRTGSSQYDRRSEHHSYSSLCISIKPCSRTIWLKSRLPTTAGGIV